MLAVGVSGGADSLALALLADGWARARGGRAVGLIVDHGLRAGSGAEAALTRARLAGRGIAGEVLMLRGLARGAGLAARARAARYAALESACAARGIVHLLLAHHAGDQAETLLLRRAAGSGADGLAGMAAIVERRAVRVLRPLLDVPRGRLRAGLLAVGMGWVDDPSNADPAAGRTRMRAVLADADGAGAATGGLVGEAAGQAMLRAAGEAADAHDLAGRVSLFAAGYAVLTAGALPPRAFSALLRVVGGRDYAPEAAALARAPRPATLGGVRLLPAGRWGPAGALLAVREAAAMGGAVPAVPGAVWDGRFRLVSAGLPEGAMLGALGDDAPGLRRRAMADAVARTLPALRVSGKLFAVPHLGYPDAATCGQACVLFAPGAPVFGAPFLGSGAAI